MAALVITTLSFSTPALSCQSPTMLACFFNKDLRAAYIERMKTYDAIQLSRQKTAERVEYAFDRNGNFIVTGGIVALLSMVGLLIYSSYQMQAAEKEILKAQLEAAKAQNTPFSDMVKAEIQKKESQHGIFKH